MCRSGICPSSGPNFLAILKHASRTGERLRAMPSTRNSGARRDLAAPRNRSRGLINRFVASTAARCLRLCQYWPRDIRSYRQPCSQDAVSREGEQWGHLSIRSIRVVQRGQTQAVPALLDLHSEGLPQVSLLSVSDRRTHRSVGRHRRRQLPLGRPHSGRRRRRRSINGPRRRLRLRRPLSHRRHPSSPLPSGSPSSD